MTLGEPGDSDAEAPESGCPWKFLMARTKSAACRKSPVTPRPSRWESPARPGYCLPPQRHSVPGYALSRPPNARHTSGEESGERCRRAQSGHEVMRELARRASGSIGNAHEIGSDCLQLQDGLKELPGALAVRGGKNSNETVGLFWLKISVTCMGVQFSKKCRTPSLRAAFLRSSDGSLGRHLRAQHASRGYHVFQGCLHLRPTASF